MTLKKINPEDLVIGRKYLVEMKLRLKDDSGVPLCFEGVPYDEYWFIKDQPIYSLDQTDTDLEMLVNVASRLRSDYNMRFCQRRTDHTPKNNEIAREAADLITACKQALKEVNHD